MSAMTSPSGVSSILISPSLSQRPLVALVMYRLHDDDLIARLFTGEILSVELEDRHVALGVAKRQLFVLAIVNAPNRASIALVRELIDYVEVILSDTSREFDTALWGGGRGGSGAGPAELRVVELGVTVRRERGKA
jgi:hypothetical protein